MLLNDKQIAIKQWEEVNSELQELNEKVLARPSSKLVLQFIKDRQDDQAAIVYSRENDDNKNEKWYKQIITWLRARGRKKSIALVTMNIMYGIAYIISFRSINQNKNGSCYAKQGEITPLFENPETVQLLGETIDFGKGQKYHESTDKGYSNVSLGMKILVLIEIIFCCLYSIKYAIKLIFKLHRGKYYQFSEKSGYLIFLRGFTLLFLTVCLNSWEGQVCFCQYR